jgi:hypothetical protein
MGASQLAEARREWYVDQCLTGVASSCRGTYWVPARLDCMGYYRWWKDDVSQGGGVMRLQCSQAAHGTKGLPEARILNMEIWNRGLILNMEPRLGTTRVCPRHES